MNIRIKMTHVEKLAIMEEARVTWSAALTQRPIRESAHDAMTQLLHIATNPDARLEIDYEIEVTP